ncbi:MAG TPA: glycoside hydrolase family 25 protein [Kofleriaceae bacterium]|nr:glycoside hydrolase family 25 protein [Kofleriaceae bacterium]
MSSRSALVLLVTAASALAGCMTGEEEDLGAGQGLAEEDGLDDFGDGKADGIGDRVCADGATLKGIDVSKWQGNIDWGRVRNAGIEFAFIRVSDGTASLDPKFNRNWTNAKAAGVVRGAYQFFRPSQDPIAQANRLIAAVGQLGPTDLPPVVDVEVTGGLSPTALRSKLDRWIVHVERELGRRPIIYSGSYFWRDQVRGGTAYAKHPFWIAQYTSRCPRLPSPWRRWAFWQNSDRGRISGIVGPVDTNFFNGTRADLVDLIASTNLTALPPPNTDSIIREPVEHHDEIEDITAYPR